VLGEACAHNPSLNEVAIAAGVWGVDVLLLTAKARVVLAVTVGDMRLRSI
jgi:hypothetical protein